MDTWGNGPDELGDWLINTSGAFALVVGACATNTAERFSVKWGSPITNASVLLTVEDETGWQHPAQRLRGHRVLTEVEVLFWPEVLVDPLRLLGTLAAHQPLVAVWPGEISNGRGTYSRPGRPDYYDSPIPKEAVVLRSRAATFPDELPYVVERIS